MTLNEVIYDIKERLQAEDSDDRSVEFSDELIIFRYEKKRARLIEQKYNSTRGANQILVQHFKVEMEMVDRSLCPSVPVGCKILRSKEPIPSVIWLHRGAFIDRVGSMDLSSKGYTYIDASRVAHAYSSVVNMKKPVYAFIQNNYLFVVSKNPIVNAIENVALSAVFEEPSVIMLGGNCAGGDCSRYPLSASIHDVCAEMVIQELATKYMIPEDNENDANPTLVQLSNGGKK